MNSRSFLCLTFLSIAAGLCATPLLAQANPAPSFFLHDGDRVTFYGDSITAQREYTRDVEDYVLTRFPHWKVDFHNAGVGGDKVSGGSAGPVDLRLQRDVFDAHPNVVTIMLGMNDGYYRASEPGIASTYQDGFRHIVDSLQKNLPQARITLIQPSPYDDITREPLFAGGYNGVLLQYSHFLEQLSREKQTGLADLNTPVTGVLTALNQQNHDLAQQFIPDRVHPAEGGHWIMAGALLKAWNAPALVSSVALSASPAKVSSAMNATVSDLRAGKVGLTWTQTEAALPLPFPPSEVDPVLAMTLKTSDLVSTLDQEMLIVGSLKAGKYDLRIDDRLIGSFSADELAKGINLAVLDTPMLEQSRLLEHDTQKKNVLEEARFQIINKSLEAESSSIAKALEQALPSAVDRQHADAQPRAHRFEIKGADAK
jgi:lysophospholipase L1-like esterase